MTRFIYIYPIVPWDLNTHILERGGLKMETGWCQVRIGFEGKGAR